MPGSHQGKTGWHGTGPVALVAWTYPVVADGCLYIRNQEMLWCFDVKERGQ